MSGGGPCGLFAARVGAEVPLTRITTQVVRVRNDIPRIIRDYKWWDNAYTAVGWDAYSGKYPNGTLVSQVAIWNEFGTHNEDGSVRNPARPFMRPAYQENKAALDTLRRDVVVRVNEGKLTPEKGLNILGYRMWQWVRSKILSNVPPPLAARTLAKKRRAGRPAVTLIDTRRMLDTLTYKIYLGRFNPSAQTTVQAQQAGANARRITGDTAAKQSAKAQALAAKVMTAKQIRREKRALRAELTAAKAAKKREVSQTKRVFRVARAGIKRRKAANKRKEEKQYRTKVRNDARKAKAKSAAEVRRAKESLRRDARQARGLTRNVRRSPAGKAAIASRKRLVASNQKRLRAEKQAERREIKAEQAGRAKVKRAAAIAKRAATRAAKRDRRQTAAAKQKAQKIVRRSLNRFLSDLEDKLK